MKQSEWEIALVNLIRANEAALTAHLRLSTDHLSDKTAAVYRAMKRVRQTALRAYGEEIRLVVKEETGGVP